MIYNTAMQDASRSNVQYVLARPGPDDLNLSTFNFKMGAPAMQDGWVKLPPTCHPGSGIQARQLFIDGGGEENECIQQLFLNYNTLGDL